MGSFHPARRLFVVQKCSAANFQSVTPERNVAVCSAAPDGKLYDAYVSHLHPSSRSDEAEVFALQMLPEKLETQHGYSLYIRGRDDCAGEGQEKVFSLGSLCKVTLLLCGNWLVGTKMV